MAKQLPSSQELASVVWAAARLHADASTGVLDSMRQIKSLESSIDVLLTGYREIIKEEKNGRAKVEAALRDAELECRRLRKSLRLLGADGEDVPAKPKGDRKGKKKDPEGVERGGKGKKGGRPISVRRALGTPGD